MLAAWLAETCSPEPSQYGPQSLPVPCATTTSTPHSNARAMSASIPGTGAMWLTKARIRTGSTLMLFLLTERR